ncbi:MAG: NfeD family protein [Alphaproteobacteria bacterium]|nr:NfeD family protein [Alphaproteobacteria bacterium]
MLTSPGTAWVVVGLTLSLLELIVPGVYLIWFGLAGFVMSIIVYITPLVFTTQLIWFALISAVFACIGLYVYRYIFSKATVSEEYKNLNNSAEQLVGMKVTVAEDSEDNQTKVKVGDTFWLAYSEKPFKKGDTVKVVGVKDSLILVIE